MNFPLDQRVPYMEVGETGHVQWDIELPGTVEWMERAGFPYKPMIPPAGSFGLTQPKAMAMLINTPETKGL